MSFKASSILLDCFSQFSCVQKPLNLNFCFRCSCMFQHVSVPPLPNISVLLLCGTVAVCVTTQAPLMTFRSSQKIHFVFGWFSLLQLVHQLSHFSVSRVWSDARGYFQKRCEIHYSELNIYQSERQHFIMPSNRLIQYVHKKAAGRNIT